MSRTLILGAAALAVSVPIIPAHAQSGNTSDRAAITVLAPRAEQVGRTSSGVPVRQLTAQSVVYIDDLNLDTKQVRDELRDRVKVAAKNTCDWLDQVYPLAQPIQGTDDCVGNAMARADDQIEAAIAAYK